MLNRREIGTPTQISLGTGGSAENTMLINPYLTYDLRDCEILAKVRCGVYLIYRPGLIARVSAVSQN